VQVGAEQEVPAVSHGAQTQGALAVAAVVEMVFEEGDGGSPEHWVFRS